MARYAVTPKGDGHRPGYSEASDDYVAAPGEVLVDDPPSDDAVWDEGTDSLRSLTYAERLAAAKTAKIDEIVREGVDGLGALFPGGRDEVMHLIVADLLNLHTSEPAPPDSRLVTLAQRGQEALVIKTALEAATTLEEVAAVAWGP